MQLIGNGEPSAVISVAGCGPVDVSLGRPFSFGRSDGPDGRVGLDPTDLGISGNHGEVAWEGRTLVLRNHSMKRPLFSEYRDIVLHQTVLPGSSHAFVASALILVPGLVHTHAIQVALPADYRPNEASPLGDTHVSKVTVTDLELDALVAVFARYLRRWPHHDAEPYNYAEATGLLADVGPDAVRRRIERVREKILNEDGKELEGRHAMWDLAAYVIDVGIIHPQDLNRINEEVRWKGPDQ
jgi:hypothetical protein